VDAGQGLGNGRASETTLIRQERIQALNADVCFHGLIFDIVEKLVDTPHGPTRYEFAVCDDAVRVYPIDTQGRLWLIREVKRGVSDDRILRTVSGAIEPGEGPVDAARRELKEELGMLGKSMSVFHLSTPTLKLLHNLHHVVVTGLSPPPAGWRPADADEDIEPYPVAVSDLEDLVWSGSIVEDAIAFAMLRLRRSWPMPHGVGSAP
jgi:8-oxo-dGTP pyrophosphatase MutT (NUDIX family)